MKKLLSLLISFYCLQTVSAQGTDSTLEIVNWNIEWFGSATNGPKNKELQERNVVKILRYLNADIFALAEIVDENRLKRVVDSLGSDHGYVLSDFSSLASSRIDPDWKTGQKLAFIYRKSVVSNVQVKGMLRSSTLAYYNFAAGRFPYILNANINVKGEKRNINVFLIHGKAGSTNTDYDRRKAAADEMKDSLDAYYSNSVNIIVGDFNDDFDRSISLGRGPESSYTNLIGDSTDNDHYKAITLPLSYAGENSTLGYSDMIDHQVVSNEAFEMYVPGSARVSKDILSVVPDYNTGNTSDHFPIFSMFKVIAGDTSAAVIITPPVIIPVVTATFRAWPNPFINELFLKSGMNLTNVELGLYNQVGQLLWTNKIAVFPMQTVVDISVPFYPAGLYFLKVTSREMNKTIKLIKQ